MSRSWPRPSFLATASKRNASCGGHDLHPPAPGATAVDLMHERSANAAELGERSRWDAAPGELLWVDILAGVLRCA